MSAQWLAQRLVNVRAIAGEVREANHEAVGLASGWQVAKQLTQQSAQQE
jgi:hypothetical protein